MSAQERAPRDARPGSPRALLQAIGRDPRARVGAALLVFFAVVALVGPLLVSAADAPVDVPLSPPSTRHWLGTTGQGQDVLAQTVVGARISLAIGLLVGIGVTTLGAIVGTIAGYFGGRVDAALSLLLNVFLVIPGLPLAIVLAAYLPSGPATLAFVMIVSGWAWNARVVRAETLSIGKRDFVAAAIVAGESHAGVLRRQILPSLTSVLVAQTIGSTLYAIGAEVGLEFLGLGDVSRVTWGTNLYWAANDSALLTGAWWTFVPTGLSIALVGFALTTINSAFDELTNPRLQVERLFRERLGRALVSADTPVVPDDPV